MASEITEPQGTVDGVAARPRVEWLDGVRGAAAFYVVLHHTWLLSFRGFPDNAGPGWTGWMTYGHLAVAVFIVVSGFSLSLAPVARGYRLKEGTLGFIRRRFWRIVPPFWAALALASILVWAGLIPTPSGEPLAWRDVLVHALILHDTIGNVSPNGVFWSIAVEWHIYFLFPLILLAARRWGSAVAGTLVAGAVLAQHLAAPFVPLAAFFDRFTPQFLALFVAGVFAVALARDSRASRWAGIAGALGWAAFPVLAASVGARAVVANFFWVDLWIGLCTAGLFAAMAAGHLRPLRWVLASRPLRSLGTFAFSLYLVHAPMLELVRGVGESVWGFDHAQTFAFLLVVGVPVAVAASFGFYVVFEKVFVTARSLSAVIDAVRPSRRQPEAA
ncbi:acyltransferase [Sinomonas sp. ASV322]|uniref:acyltransferase family protein n=1 Tax=Sinomonas sp. ASV322 TaxID=3041920 RepID=UPI0027DC249E|nr:acyltransferase [Sinomonas sp. ASV322]MDQ4504343.1 acyltransferase [Sinomonas sp. ASV322]